LLYQPANIARLYHFTCSEVCGQYYIGYGAFEDLRDARTTRNVVLHAIRENILANESGLIPYWRQERTSIIGLPNNLQQNSIPKYFEDYKDLPIPHSDKPKDILISLATKLNRDAPFSKVRLSSRDFLKLRVADRAELYHWTKALMDSGFIRSQEAAALGRLANSENHLSNSNFEYSITPEGWETVEKFNQPIHSKKAFIAMRFSNNPDRGPIQAAIERACSETGWEASTIDREEFVGGISDEIIAKINQSAFIIADFTGQNQGVYYEAGYASGMGKVVILTVKEGDTDNLHFDTKHLNHIVWIDSEDLYKKVKTRIEAVINR
tara:strand:- start:1166 stop:2134 length:969 start_codon:yes stop_codon:yes gene_type:complete